MVLKTRDRLIEVARQLFARKGIENTTMNDIASASDKGRRTIYTYFKNKRDIFNAVVEQETESLMRKLTDIENRDISPSEKLEQYIACRFETMREIVSRNGSLKAGFFRDVRKVDRARKIISTREIEILSRILRQGQAAGQFSPGNAEHAAHGDSALHTWTGHPLYKGQPHRPGHGPDHSDATAHGHYPEWYTQAHAV